MTKIGGWEADVRPPPAWQEMLEGNVPPGRWPEERGCLPLEQVKCHDWHERIDAETLRLGPELRSGEGKAGSVMPTRPVVWAADDRRQAVLRQRPASWLAMVAAFSAIVCAKTRFLVFSASSACRTRLFAVSYCSCTSVFSLR